MKGAMDTYQIIQLAVTVVGLIAGAIVLRMSVDAYRSELKEFKAELNKWKDEVTSEFRGFRSDIQSLSERILVIETLHRQENLNAAPKASRSPAPGE